MTLTVTLTVTLTATLTVTITVTLTVTLPVVQLVTLNVILTASLLYIGATQRVFELIDRESAIPSNEGVKIPDFKGLIEIDNVCFTYPARPNQRILSSLTITLHPGTVTALVGGSGGGKSTIASLIMRLYDPDSGAIRIDGRDLKGIDLRWLHENVALVQQEPILFSGSVVSNIKMGKRSDVTDEMVIEVR